MYLVISINLHHILVTVRIAEHFSNYSAIRSKPEVITRVTTIVLYWKVISQKKFSYFFSYRHRKILRLSFYFLKIKYWKIATKHVTYLNSPRSDQSSELFRWEVMRRLRTASSMEEFHWKSIQKLIYKFIHIIYDISYYIQNIIECLKFNVMATLMLVTSWCHHDDGLNFKILVVESCWTFRGVANRVGPPLAPDGYANIRHQQPLPTSI